MARAEPWVEPSGAHLEGSDMTSVQLEEARMGD